jgi:hypothetical protein
MIGNGRHGVAAADHVNAPADDGSRVSAARSGQGRDLTPDAASDVVPVNSRRRPIGGRPETADEKKGISNRRGRRRIQPFARDLALP